MLRTIAMLTCCALTALPAAAQDAQEPVPSPLTLDEALSRAAATSHRLAELRAREGAARSAATGRGAERLPVVGAQVGYTRTNHVDAFGVPEPDGTLNVIYPDVPDNYRSRLELQWPIYTGGRLEALERAASAEARATGSELAAARADLKLEVTRAYWALVTARETARVLTEAVARVDAQLSDVRSRFEAGFVPPNDVLSVEAERARQEGQRLQAVNLAASAEADLARLIDAPAGSHIELDVALTPAASMPVEVTPALLQDARQHRPERAALGARVQAADHRARAAHAGALPTVSLFTGVDYARPNPRIFPRQEAWKTSWDVGVTVGWTLWDGGRTGAAVAETSFEAAAARERLADFDAGLALDIRQRLLDLDTARAQIGAAEQGVKSAAEARRVVQERFAAGVSTTTDLLDAQVALLQAELDRTRAIANTRLASARLDRALGR